MFLSAAEASRAPLELSGPSALLLTASLRNTRHHAAPEPEGLKTAPIAPAGAYYHAGMGEFILPYEAVRTADDPEGAIMAFIESTYNHAANLAGWDRTALER